MIAPQLSLGLRPFAAADPGSWQPLLDLACAADEAGFDRLSVSDHVVFGDHIDQYARPELGGSAGGVQPTGPDGHWLEPLTTLSVISGMTSRIRLSTAVLLAALRRPVVLAKMASTLDVLSGGRLDLGVGVGWQREEYDAAGLAFEERGKLLDQTLELCKRLWTEPTTTIHEGRLEATRVHMMPKPVQPGGIPIWISGTVNPAMLRRLARFGAGWIPWGPAIADIRPALVRVRQHLTDAGRDPDELQVLCSLTVRRHSDVRLDLDETFAPVADLIDAGVTDFRVRADERVDPRKTRDELYELAESFRRRSFARTNI
jgi:probable F420-dependent oxidoreductase